MSSTIVSPETALAVAGLLKHRGPDGYRQKRTRVGDWEVFLHHSRLAIIDLHERATQPFERNGLTLVFNGEIYNYLELRAELRALGHAFETESDTEVVLEAYRRWGEDCVARFEGMWALALADEARGGLWLSRDRFGEKPLFYTVDGGRLVFASEVKALAALLGRWPEVEDERLRDFLVNGYKVIFGRSDSWYRGVKALAAGSSCFVKEPTEVVQRRYWHLGYHPRAAMTLAEAETGTLERLERALALRLRADVPIAFCLSGGVDSSLLACLAARKFGQGLHAFSVIDRDVRYDEGANIGRVASALGCCLHKVEVSRDGFFDRMERLVRGHDAPIATISYYVHSFLSEAIAGEGYKVAISGTGADELFSGYYDHYSFWLAEQADRPDFADLLADWRQSFGRHVRNPILQDPLVFRRNPHERGHITLDREVFNDLMVEPLDRNLEEVDFSDNLLRKRMLNELFREIVPVILAEDDLNSMMWSIENRSPFLDRGLVEFAYTIPNRHLIQRGYSKWMLRAAGKGVVPEDVRLDRRKRGFNASIDSLIDRQDPASIERLLAPSPIFDIVRRDRMEHFLLNDMTDNSLSKFLFSFVSARIFLDQQCVTLPQGASAA